MHHGDPPVLPALDSVAGISGDADITSADTRSAVVMMRAALNRRNRLSPTDDPDDDSSEGKRPNLPRLYSEQERQSALGVPHVPKKRLDDART